MREEWAAAVDAILELQERTAELRTRFYATDDPYVRDGQVKPAWDQALESLGEARVRARQLEEELESLDALLLLRERAAGDNGTRHALADVARELGAEDLLDPDSHPG